MSHKGEGKVCKLREGLLHATVGDQGEFEPGGEPLPALQASAPALVSLEGAFLISGEGKHPSVLRVYQVGVLYIEGGDFGVRGQGHGVASKRVGGHL